MGKNRDRLSIIASILTATNSGSSKTHIMHKANLSFKLVEKYLDSVVTTGLLKPEGSRYLLTIQGREFLKHYNDYQDHYAEAQRFFESLSSERRNLSKLCESPKTVRSIRAQT